MKKALFILSFLCLSLSALAQGANILKPPEDNHYNSNYNMAGIVSKEAGRTYLTDRNNSHVYEITGSSIEVERELRKLKSSDFLSGVATLTSETTATIHSIDFVGLQKLLRLWGSQNSHYFQFLDYNNLNLILRPDPKKNNFELHKIQYGIAPAQNSNIGWSIFFVGNQRVEIGKIFFVGSSAQIDILDVTSGRIAKTFKLRPTTLLNDKNNFPVAPSKPLAKDNFLADPLHLIFGK